MEQSLTEKKIAIVHDWFTIYAGSEKVVEQILQVFPKADLFGLVDFIPSDSRDFLLNKAVHTSFLQNFPFINQKNYRQYLPFMPLAIEQFDLSAYDIIISSCHAVAKGIITGPDQLHISYIHSPMRYAWDMQNAYLENSKMNQVKGVLARILLHYIRSWDLIASSRPDKMIANSEFIARRISKIYRRESQVIYPPVDTNYYHPAGPREDFYLAASRFVPYKRMDLIVKAFRSLPDKKLVLIGDGPELSHLKSLFGPNITWLGGYQTSEVLRDYMRHCKAFIFAAKEDFGIMPLEAQACGAPVIAFGEGGATETVRGHGCTGQTGLFFEEQSVASLQAAILEFEKMNILPEDCRLNAELFSNQRFQREFLSFVINAWNNFQKSIIVNS